MEEDFYLRYYVGHDGKYGHESLEFEIRPDGLLRYSNSSNYRNERCINKQVFVGKCVLEGLKDIILDSQILEESDERWIHPTNNGRQELEIVYGDSHISFATAKIGSLNDVNSSNDPDGMRLFYYLVQDLKCLIFSLISLHFKIQPI